APLDVELTRARDLAAAVAAIEALASGPGGTETAEPLALAGVWRGAEGRSGLGGLAVTGDGDAVLWLDGDLVAAPAVAAALDRLLAARPFHAHNAKPLLRSLIPLGVDARWLGIDT